MLHKTRSINPKQVNHKPNGHLPINLTASISLGLIPSDFYRRNVMCDGLPGL